MVPEKQSIAETYQKIWNEKLEPFLLAFLQNMYEAFIVKNFFVEWMSFLKFYFFEEIAIKNLLKHGI